MAKAKETTEAPAFEPLTTEDAVSAIQNILDHWSTTQGIRSRADLNFGSYRTILTDNRQD